MLAEMRFVQRHGGSATLDSWSVIDHVAVVPLRRGPPPIWFPVFVQRLRLVRVPHPVRTGCAKADVLGTCSQHKRSVS
jgi:hypothetical protein